MFRSLPFFLFTAVSAHAATTPSYDLALKLKSNGKEISAPRVVVREGEKAKITQKDVEGTTFWEIEARKEGAGSVHVSVNVGLIDNSGRRRWLSRPRIVALENEPAEISIGGGDQELVTVSVVAKRRDN